jgi:putative SOS response-associated peptidase YedK
LLPVRFLRDGDELRQSKPRFANETVKPIHGKAMPVILTEPGEFEAWLSAPAEEALQLQKPLAAEWLRIVARGEKEDAVPGTALLAG